MKIKIKKTPQIIKHSKQGSNNGDIFIEEILKRKQQSNKKRKNKK